MAILEIKKYPGFTSKKTSSSSSSSLPSEVRFLRKKCEEVKEITQDIKKLIEDMIETMVGASGIGLAAPQVGQLKRIIVVQDEEGVKVFINPIIISKSKKTELVEEGCLSFPGLFLKIKRAKEIEVEALNIKGEKVRIKTSGLPARIFQHEIDHLDGILSIDRAGLWQKIKTFFIKIIHHASR